VANTGNTSITGVSLSDTLVAVVGSPTESISSNGQLDVGETWTWSYSYTAAQSDIDDDGGGDGDIDNTATVSSNEVGDQSDSQAVPIVQGPSLVINKEVSDDNSTWVESVTVLVNDTVYYRVRVANTGNTTLTGLSVSDPDCTPVRGADITGNNDSNFESGEEWAYYCSLSAGAGSHTNTATADTNETSPDSDTADYLGVAPPQISKVFSPNSINAGEVSTLTFTITNPNTSTDFTGVQFNDTFPTTPGAMTVASPANASTDCGGSVTAVSGSGSMSFSGGSIPAGGTCTVEVDVTASVEGVYVNTSGNVSAANGGTGNQASAALNVGAALIIDPAVTKTGNPASAQVGDTVTFTLVVTNNGNANAIDVVVTDPLPAFLDYVGAAAPGSALIDYDLPSNTVTIYYDTVQPTDSFTITITTVVNALGEPPGGTNTATLTSLTTDIELANNRDSTQIEIIEVSGLPSPDTGFAPNRLTSIPGRPPGFSYLKLGELSLQIPDLGLETTIVGVPLTEGSWDVTWLWNQVGYLDGTAFPGWNGNSVLTGHVYLPNGMPGPFVGLDQLAWGDQVIVEVYGTRYTYEVRENLLYAPDDSRIIRHQETPWLTLVTCQGFNEQTGEYRWRRVVRAVLISAEQID
jgi:LPXTG-site transpeptidase (sortase) family protein